MAKTKVSEWSTTPSSNTDIDGINIAEGCAPSGINDAIRDMMAQIRSWQSGTYGDTFNGPVNGTVGATTPATGAFTTLSASSTVTLSGGTANGVTYLNGSKVLTSGSALTFDGTNLGVGGAASTKLHVQTTGADTEVRASTFTSGNVRYGFDASGAVYNWIQTERSSGAMQFAIGNAEQMRLTSTGLGIGTSSPSEKLTVAGGNISIGAGYKLQYSSTAYMTPEDNVSGARIVTGGILSLATGGTTVRAVLDASGNLGLGVTPSAWLSSRKVFQFGATGSIANNSGNTLLGDNYYTDSTPANKYLTSSYATLYQQTSGTHVWYNAPSGTAGNAISFTQAMTLDASGNLLVGGTSIAALDGVFGAVIGGSSKSASGISIESSTSQWLTYTDSYQAMIFYDARLNAERARIDSSGNLLIGRTSQFGSERVSIESASTNTLLTTYNFSATSVTHHEIRNQNGVVGSIVASGGSTSYNTSSDQRLKENIANADSASTLIDSLQVRKFDWKADGSHQRYGFIAQELVTVVPEAVYQPEDTEQMMAVDYSKLVPMLVKEVQSLRKRLADAGL